MYSFTSVVALALAAVASVTATPIPRDVPISKCTAIAKGNLRSATGHFLHLDSSSKHLAFGSSKLAVEFQSCQPNFGHYDGKGGAPVGGHIYVPSQKKCLTVDLESEAKPPFGFKLADCEYSDDSIQTFSNFIKQKDGKIYFVGGTQKDGSNIYYGDECRSGYFGVSSSQTSGAAKFKCVNDGHVVGLNV